MRHSAILVFANKQDMVRGADAPCCHRTIMSIQPCTALLCSASMHLPSWMHALALATGKDAVFGPLSHAHDKAQPMLAAPTCCLLVKPCHGKHGCAAEASTGHSPGV